MTTSSRPPLGPTTARPNSQPSTSGFDAAPRVAPSGQEGAVFESGDIAGLVRFVQAATCRHRALAILIFLCIVALGALSAALMPRHYVIRTKMLAERNVVMPALVERRASTAEGDTPTRLATEAVMNRENLVGIVREVRLLADWPVIRSPLGRLRDQLVQRIRGPIPDSMRVNALIDVLRSRMSVETSEGTVTIELDWMDANSGYRIVQVAQQHFFDQRRASEVAMIEESIRILEGHVATAQQAMQDVLASVPRSARLDGESEVRALLRAPRYTSERPSPRAADAAVLTAALRAKDQTIIDLESGRNERLSSLQSRLADLRKSYGPAHPEIVSLEEELRALAVESPRLRDLRNEARALRMRLAALGVSPDGSVTQDVGASSVVAQPHVRSEPADPPDLMYVKSRLKIATGVYEDLLERLEGARLGLETANAGFKYRYTIITPPELPRRPSRPNVALLILGSIVLGAGLAFFTVVAVEVSSGRLLQSWQIRRQLGLHVLAEFPLP